MTYLSSSRDKKILASLFSFAVLFSFSAMTLYAQGDGGSVADVCGSENKHCTLSDLGDVLNRFFVLLISIGLPLLVVIISYRGLLAWFALSQGKEDAYRKELKKIGQALIGFVVIVGVLGGVLFGVLEYLGVKKEILDVMRNILSDAFATSAYAQTDPQKINPLSITNVYDFILAVFRIFLRFIVYPGLVFIWVRVGLEFVLAQGAPERLAKAKKWLLGAFVTTIVIFMVQTFLLAVKGSVDSIFGSKKTTSSTKNGPVSGGGDPVGTADGRVAPKDGNIGASCQVGSQYGTIDSTGKCNIASRGGSDLTTTSPPVKSCGGQKQGTPCVLSGSTKKAFCDNNEDGVFGCYAEPGQ